MDAASPDDPALKQLRLAAEADPTNLHLRFKLGEALCLRQNYHAAIPELCHGTCAPSVRLAAMKLLVEAFDATHLHLMAARLREKLARESGEEGDSGSAPVPAPTHPIGPSDLSCAEKRPQADAAV